MSSSYTCAQHAQDGPACDWKKYEESTAFLTTCRVIAARKGGLCQVAAREIATAYKLGDPFPCHFQWEGKGYILREPAVLTRLSNGKKKQSGAVQTALAEMDDDTFARLIVALTQAQKITTHWSEVPDDVPVPATKKRSCEVVDMGPIDPKKWAAAATTEPSERTVSKDIQEQFDQAFVLHEAEKKLHKTRPNRLKAILDMLSSGKAMEYIKKRAETDFEDWEFEYYQFTEANVQESLMHAAATPVEEEAFLEQAYQYYSENFIINGLYHV